MMKLPILPRILAGLFWMVGCTTAAHGSGFGVFTQGAAALGQADAVVAHADGPSALFFNPALINGLPGTELEVGTTLVVPRRRMTEPTGTTASTRDTIFLPSTFYLAHAFNQNWSAGLAVFNPFGLGTDWGGNWSGRYLVTEAQLQSYNINPVLSLRLLPGLTFAAGVDLVLLDATLEGKVASTELGFPGPPLDLDQRFSGSGRGLGYNIGLLVQPVPELSLGVSYRSAVKVRMHGELTLQGVAQETSGSASVTLPQQVFAGLAYLARERLTLEAGMRWEDWSSFDQLRVELEEGRSIGPETFPFGEADPRQWHSTFAINFGGRYRVGEAFWLSAGYLYGFNPVPDRSFEPAIADADSHLFCVGAQARWDKVRLAVGYGYQLQQDRSKSTNLYGDSANGRYEAYLHLIGVSVGYGF